MDDSELVGDLVSGLLGGLVDGHVVDSTGCAFVSAFVFVVLAAERTAACSTGKVGDGGM